jgi:hypothetical protein
VQEDLKNQKIAQKDYKSKNGSQNGSKNKA